MFWTAQQVADHLNVSKKLVYALAEKGQIPSFRFGNCVRFDPEKVREWVSSCAVTPPEPASRPSVSPSGPSRTGDMIDRIVGKVVRSRYNQFRAEKPAPRKRSG